MTEDTSLGVQGEMKKEFKLGFAKYDSGDLGPVYTGSDPNGIGSIWIRSTF